MKDMTDAATIVKILAKLSISNGHVTRFAYLGASVMRVILGQVKGQFRQHVFPMDHVSRDKNARHQVDKTFQKLFVGNFQKTLETFMRNFQET